MRIETNAPSAVPAVAFAAPPQRSFRSLVAFGSSPRLSAVDARSLLANAWQAVTGRVAEPHTSALLTAHWAVETDGGRCMPGHNFAGIKAAPSARGETFSTVEGHGPAKHEIQARFRVYESPEAGALDYVSLLARRYPDAVAAAASGDSAGFARALAKGGYFTADLGAYAAALQSRLAALDEGLHGHAFASPGLAPGLLPRIALEGLLHALRPSPDDG